MAMVAPPPPMWLSARQPLPTPVVAALLVTVALGWAAFWSGLVPQAWAWETFWVLGFGSVGTAYAGFAVEVVVDPNAGRVQRRIGFLGVGVREGFALSDFTTVRVTRRVRRGSESAASPGSGGRHVAVRTRHAVHHVIELVGPLAALMGDAAGRLSGDGRGRLAGMERTLGIPADAVADDAGEALALAARIADAGGWALERGDGV